jgi:hypothetical protein
MVRDMGVAAILSLCAASALAQEAQPAARPAPPSPPPMRFEWVQEGPADKCGDNCRSWVAAAGQITPETVVEFRKFADGRDLKGATVVIDSPGGAVLGSLELGREFRKLGVTTTVGKTNPLLAAEGEAPRATLHTRALCSSMCAFILLGGVRRHVPPDARVVVHQIWPSASRPDPTAATYSARELARIERELGLIARYTIDMGGDIELFETAMRIPPWEALRPLSPDELRRMRLHNSDTAFGPAAAVPDASRPAASSASAAPAAPAPAPDRAWTLLERSGRPLLARRYPLTIEGEEIGLFEIALTCANSPEHYGILYQERRRTTAPSSDTDKLNEVAIIAGRTRALLKVQESGPVSAGSGLRTIASGRIPASLFVDFAAGRVPTIAVTTKTTANVRTDIRVGGVGFSDSLEKMLDKCRATAKTTP